MPVARDAACASRSALRYDTFRNLSTMPMRQKLRELLERQDLLRTPGLNLMIGALIGVN